MNTLVLAPFSRRGLLDLEGLGNVVYEPWTETQRLYDPEELGLRLERDDFGALVVEADFLFDELFQAAPSLRFAALCRAALNQLDMETATEHNVVVVHTPGRNALAVAEMVLGLLLSLARHIPQAHDYVSSMRWDDPSEPYRVFQGRELGGGSLGIIGLGETGKMVAKLGRGVGMKVLAYDPYVRSDARRAKTTVMVGLDRLLAESDFVSVHVPDTPETVGLISAERLGLMRSTAYLVNVAAPSVVDKKALVDALIHGRIAGAAIDVHEAHPILPTSSLLGLPNVVLTPHIGGATAETVERHSQMAVTDLKRFLIGKRPKHLANPEVWMKRGRGSSDVNQSWNHTQTK